MFQSPNGRRIGIYRCDVLDEIDNLPIPIFIAAAISLSHCYKLHAHIGLSSVVGVVGHTVLRHGGNLVVGVDAAEVLVVQVVFRPAKNQRVLVGDIPVHVLGVDLGVVVV